MGQGSFKWTVSKCKSVLWSDKSTFDILVGSHRHRVLRAKEEGGRPSSVSSAFSSKASISDGMGCIRAYGMGILHVLEGNVSAERYLKFLEQHMLPSRRRVFQGRPCVF